MKKLIALLLTAVAVIPGLNCSVWAQATADAPPPAEKPAAEPVPAPPAKPVTPPAATAAAVARLLDADLLDVLRDGYSAPRGDTGITGPDKLCIITLPAGCEVYVASISEIREAKTPDGAAAAVEDVVFNADHYLGEAPLVTTLPANEYVLAVRTYGRTNGFDAVDKGVCISKTTKDIITGGIRHAYHLYPMRKREGEFQLFVANFSNPDADVEAAAHSPKGTGVFNLDLETLAADIATTTNVPEDQRAKIAGKLNEQGVAFYEVDGTQYFVKLTLLGVSYRIEEWPVE